MFAVHVPLPARNAAHASKCARSEQHVTACAAVQAWHRQPYAAASCRPEKDRQTKISNGTYRQPIQNKPRQTNVQTRDKETPKFKGKHKRVFQPRPAQTYHACWAGCLPNKPRTGDRECSGQSLRMGNEGAICAV